MITVAQLDVRRELMISHLLDWTESLDPCEHGHVQHGPEAHVGRRIVHSRSAHGFGADWDYDDVVAFIQTAQEIGAAIEATRTRASHIGVRGADGSVMAFECRP